MPLQPGDRFELPVPRETWEAGRIPLTGGFRHLVSPNGEPTAVEFRGESGRVITGMWDGEDGVLDLPRLEDLRPTAAPGQRLELHVEAAEPPRFRVGPLGQGSLDLAWGAASREIAAVPVRSDPADAEVLAAFAEGPEVEHPPLSLRIPPPRWEDIGSGAATHPRPEPYPLVAIDYSVKWRFNSAAPSLTSCFPARRPVAGRRRRDG